MLNSRLSTLLISVLLVFAIIAFSYFLFTKNFNPLSIKEETMHKNAAFSPRPGDSIAYNYTYGNESELIIFLFGRKMLSTNNLSNPVFANCTLAAVSGINITTCVGQDGTDGTWNGSLSQPFFFFSPWMLAVSENFSWNARMVNRIDGREIGNYSVKYVATDKFRGRSAYVFLISSWGVFGDYEKKVWVDVRNRVMLKEEGENYSIEIIRAYFPLQPQVE